MGRNAGDFKELRERPLSGRQKGMGTSVLQPWGANYCQNLNEFGSRFFPNSFIRP